MKIVKKAESIERKNSDRCVVTEYPMAHKEIDFALAKISGRYPSIKRVTNNHCDEVVYVKQGRGKVVVENQEYLLQQGDVVLIEAGEKYFWEGELELVISCRPAFFIEQHETVE